MPGLETQPPWVIEVPDITILPGKTNGNGYCNIALLNNSTPNGFYTIVEGEIQGKTAQLFGTIIKELHLILQGIVGKPGGF